jgi:hypothetical protein
MSAHDRFESLAAQWDAKGRPTSMLVEGDRLIALRCWTYSQGGEVDGVSPVLQAFMRASEQAQPEDWLDVYFSERETCGRCGERYRFENMMLCTHCIRTYCHRCMSGAPRSPNGNPTCACGGELVGMASLRCAAHGG